MSIATRIVDRSPKDVMFQMMIAKQKTLTDLTKPHGLCNAMSMHITYDFEDASSITFAIEDACVSVTTRSF